MLRARLFGGLSVEVHGRALPPIPGLKPRSLLAFLVLNPGPHPRSRLAGRFWPDVLETSARASLRSALWTLRATLEQVGGSDYLRGDRAGAGIALDLPRDVDVEEFDRLVGAGDRASLERAVELASGPLLADLADDWVLQAQDAYRDRLLEALARLADERERAGDVAGAIAFTRRMLEHDRLSEAAHRSLMRRLALAGERGQALAAYRRCQAVLGAELGVAPSADTRALADGLRAGGRVEEDAAGPAPPVAAPLRGRSARPPGPAGALVGRDNELGALVSAWERTRGGNGGVALVTGEPGIGKSRLAAELVRLAREQDAPVAVGGALDLEGGPPFAPWSEVLRDLVSQTPPPPESAAWPADLARLCAAVEGTWRRAPGAPAPAPDLERARLFEVVVEAMGWCSRGAPLLLVLEDLHRADAASLALLAHLGRRLAALPILVVATRRQAPESRELEIGLADIARRGALLADVTLGPLQDTAIAALVAEAAPGLDPDGAARVLAAAEGNPLLAREAARSAAAGLEPSEGLRGAVRGPLGGLSVEGRTLVELVSAAGRPLEPGEAADLVGAEALTTALAAGLEANLLATTGDRRLRFAHDLLSEACYMEVPPARRALLHARLAETLARRPGRVAAEVARHFRLAGEDAASRRYLAAAAGDARALGALTEAAAFMREAVDLAADGSEDQAEHLLALAGIEAWRGDRPATDAAFDCAVAILEQRGDTAALVAAWAERGRWLRTTLCFPREALVACRRALAILDQSGAEAPEARALALAGAAWAESVAGDPEHVPGLLAEIRSIPDVAGDRVLAAELAGAEAAALIRAGRFDEAEEPSERAASIAREVGRYDLVFVVLGNVACAAACRGDFSRALELAHRASQGARGGLSLEMVHAAEAYALSRLGRHDEALEAVDREAAVAALSGVREYEATADFDAGVILLAAGRNGEAARRLRAALEVDTRGYSRALARLCLAEALVGSGDPDSAEAELGHVPFEPVAAADHPETLVPRLARVQGLVAFQRGDATLALKRLAEAEAGWRRLVADTPLGDLFAANLTDLGRPPVAGLVEPGVELGKVLADRAQVLADAGRHAKAAAAAREACSLADAMGFDGYRSRVEEILTEAIERS
jgi:DNA-binding SARP family transcriptional activator